MLSNIRKLQINKNDSMKISISIKQLSVVISIYLVSIIFHTLQLIPSIANLLTTSSIILLWSIVLLIAVTLVQFLKAMYKLIENGLEAKSLYTIIVFLCISHNATGVSITDFIVLFALATLTLLEFHKKKSR